METLLNMVHPEFFASAVSQTVRHPTSALMLMAYIATTGACAVAGQLIPRKGSSQTGELAQWRWFGLLLVLMTLNSMLHLEFSLIIWMREIANAEQWYAWRRPVQLFALVLVIPAGVAAFRHVQQAAMVSSASTAKNLGLYGMSLLLITLGLRFVSLHYTDQVLNTHVVGISLDSWLRLVGMLLIVWGALGQIVYSSSKSG